MRLVSLCNLSTEQAITLVQSLKISLKKGDMMHVNLDMVLLLNNLKCQAGPVALPICFIVFNS